MDKNHTLDSITVIDFQPFIVGSPAEKQLVADKILASLQHVGFVSLLNHGVPQADVDKMFYWSKRFFSQDTEVKQLAPHPESGAHHRGYSYVGREKVTIYGSGELDMEKVNEAHNTTTDVKESFEVGREDSVEMPNIWLPEGVLDGFKETCQEFYWICKRAQDTILRAIALGLGVSEDYFEQFHRKADNQLRLLHYPSVSVKDLEQGRFARVSAHSDFGSITLLFQDDIGGLEVASPTEPGTFIAVEPVSGAMVVNAADFLMRWSNDTIRSSIHRVKSPSGASNKDGMLPDRYSIPYFCGVDLDAVVDAIPTTWGEDRPKKYDAISPREYVMKRLAVAY